MADPTSANLLLSLPVRGSDTGTWDLPVNGDFNSLDGHLGGVQTISLSNAPVTLTAPTGTPTPGPGPTQAENSAIVLTGALSANVQVTLPLPGPILIDNQTTGNFVVSFRAVGSGQVIATDQGTVTPIYNDGTNVRFVNLGKRGTMEFWAGINALPAWVTACTRRPYLICDGTVYNFSDYPYLGPRLGALFGGNGSTTFGVPDMSGRVPLQYDFTGTRITTAGSGINGQTIGAAGGSQNQTLALGSIPQHAHTVFLFDPGHQHTYFRVDAPPLGIAGANPGILAPQIASLTNPAVTNMSIWSNGPGFGNQNQTGATGSASPTPVNTVQPAQVTGIWVIKT